MLRVISRQDSTLLILTSAKVNHNIIIKNSAERNEVSAEDLLAKVKANPELQLSILNKIIVAAHEFFATISCFLVLPRDYNLLFLAPKEPLKGSRWERAHAAAAWKLTTGVKEGRMKKIMFIPLTAEKLKKNGVQADDEERRIEIAKAMQNEGICGDGAVDACIMAMKCAIESNLANREWEAPGEETISTLKDDKQAQQKNLRIPSKGEKGNSFLAAAEVRVMQVKFLTGMYKNAIKRVKSATPSVYIGSIKNQQESIAYTICCADDEKLAIIANGNFYPVGYDSDLCAAMKFLALVEQERRELTTTLIPFLINSGIIHKDDVSPPARRV
jgi:hypothetical protein